MRYQFFLCSILFLGLTACQTYAPPPPVVCDPNYSHCPDENEQVVAQEINTAID